ncbi:MAG: hypothetical protein WCQ44_03260, partial [Opitutaceae bacterium]
MRSHNTGMPDFRPFSRLVSLCSPGSKSGAMLRDYFRSGWAFLIPYLAAYLLYAWLKWPVNPASGGDGLVKVMSESAGALPSTAHSLLSTGVPCLLHVYWTLHAIHLMLGAIALRAWWLGSTVLRSPFSVLQTAAP